MVIYMPDLLRTIVANDTNYEVRGRLIWHAMAEAVRMGWQCGVRIDPNEPEWPVVYIELPTGQVSWHTRQHSVPWDGHSTEVKFERIKRYVESVV